MTNPFPFMQDVGARIQQAPHLLLGLDYDGTLTPIVEDPAQATLPIPMRQALEALTCRADVTVAVVSGRANADLQALVGIPEVILAGNHGMEISGPGLSFIAPGATASAEALRVLAADLVNRLGHLPGALVEDKGLTLSIHYRQAADADAKAIWHIVRDAVATQGGYFHVTLGDKVHEIRPPLPWNKGAAVNWILEQLGKPETLVIYLGDDTTDEDAFRALGDAALTIRVGDNVRTAARFLIPGPAAVQQFLRWVGELRDR